MKPETYEARNQIISYLEKIIDSDSEGLRSDFSDLLGEYLETIEDMPDFIKKLVEKLASKEEVEGKTEMKIMHISLDELKQILEELKAVEMQN